MNDCRLTTFDNPYDPFEEFSSWYMYDIEHEYNTSAYLGRLTQTSEQFSDSENDEEIERTIDDIIANDFRNIYKKVRRGEFVSNNVN